MVSPSTRDTAQSRLLILTGIDFVAYLCVALPLPIIPVFVTGHLGLGNAFAGLAVGVSFFATIASRGYAGAFSDRRGAKPAVARGLVLYVAGTLIGALAGLLTATPWLGYAVLLAGRLLLGLGESLVGVSVVAWGVGIVGPRRSSRVLALVGAAMYGALAIGGPVGLVLLDRFGFAGAMAVSAALPALALLSIVPMAGIAAHPEAVRQSFWRIVGRIWRHGSVVGLQGIGFAAIGAFFVLDFLDHHWAHAGLGLSAFGGGFVLVRLVFGHLPDRVGGVPVAIASLAVEAAGQALIWYAPDPALALAGAFLTGTGCSMIYPAMGREVVHIVEPHLRATALGGFSAFQDMSYGLTGPLAGLLADRAGYGSVFLIGAVAAAAGLALALSLRRAQVAAAAR